TYLAAGDTFNLNTKASVTDNLTVSSSRLGLTYDLGVKLYSLNETKKTLSDGTQTVTSTEKIMEWKKDYITTHKLTLSKSWNTDLGTFKGSVAYTIPPLTGTLLPSVSWSKGSYSASFSWKFVENENLSFEKNLMTFTFKYSGKNVVFSTTEKYQSKDFDASDILKPFSAVSSLQLKVNSGKYSVTESVDYTRYSASTGLTDYFSSIKTSFRADVFSGNVLFKSNAYGDVKFSQFDLSCNLSTKHVQYWKGRVYLAFSLKSRFVYNKENLSKTSFSLTPTFTVSVAEFIDVKLSFSSQNNQMRKYFVNDVLSLPLLWEDLLRSFDFIGDGRRNTSFIMKNISIEFVHYMEDWDLNCKYSTDLVKSGKVYTLQPSLSLYLSWKTMPDLKAEEKWRQIRKTDGSTEWQQY
ncbi:MAG: hypothetical protein KBS81_00485, partial [Spirochaetales bacterium]|nr:hypothetical protein [Candidatus Physcosoma equi]